MWSVYLGDTMTGALSSRVDVPSFTWTLTVSDATFQVGRDRDKGVGETSGGGVRLPYSQLGDLGPTALCAALMPLKRSLCLVWEDRFGLSRPVVWGAVGPRSDGLTETSFDLLSPLELLESRLLVREGAFGAVEGVTDVTVPDEWEEREGGYHKGATVRHGGREWESLADDNTDEPGKSDRWEDKGAVRGPQEGRFTRDEIHLSGLSLRAIACEAVRLCTSAKPGGQLPVDLPYLGEAGGHERTYDGFDAGNNSCADVLRKISDVIGGPDIRFRPYMADASHVRVRMEAGSDADAFVGQSVVHGLSFVAGRGGSVENVRVDWAGPVMRVYATGAGTDEGQLCHLSEDLSLCTTRDPWPLVEEHYADTDADGGRLLGEHADAELAASSRPQMQVSFDVDLDDPAVPPVGSIWPGELVNLHLEGFPTLPDGTYRLRVMEMSGDETTRVSVVTRQEAAPVY